MRQRAGSVKTVDQVRNEFRETGITVKDWALHHGFSPSLVYTILSQRRRGVRGESHRIAVALGLKRVSPSARVFGESCT
jgi:gp16 family phage-associated protein